MRSQLSGPSFEQAAPIVGAEAAPTGTAVRARAMFSGRCGGWALPWVALRTYRAHRPMQCSVVGAAGPGPEPASLCRIRAPGRDETGYVASPTFHNLPFLWVGH